METKPVGGKVLLLETLWSGERGKGRRGGKIIVLSGKCDYMFPWKKSLTRENESRLNEKRGKREGERIVLPV